MVLGGAADHDLIRFICQFVPAAVDHRCIGQRLHAGDDPFDLVRCQLVEVLRCAVGIVIHFAAVEADDGIELEGEIPVNMVMAQLLPQRASAGNSEQNAVIMELDECFVSAGAMVIEFCPLTNNSSWIPRSVLSTSATKRRICLFFINIFLCLDHTAIGFVTCRGC